MPYFKKLVDENHRQLIKRASAKLTIEKHTKNDIIFNIGKF